MSNAALWDAGPSSVLRLLWDGRPALCAVRQDSFIPFHAPRTRMCALDTPFRQNPRTNGTFAALRYMLESLPSPFRTGREGDPTLASQHVPQVY